MGHVFACLRLVSLSVVLALGFPGLVAAQDDAPPPLPAIPGITTEDPFPMACVSCHVVLPDGMDVRLSTLMREWTTEVGPILLEAAQDASPGSLNLAGRHPEVEASLESIPAACLMCHGRDATLAPPFARLMHRIHLVGGESNHFVTMFQGECTYCHKLDPESGSWSIPSGPEPGP